MQFALPRLTGLLTATVLATLTVLAPMTAHAESEATDTVGIAINPATKGGRDDRTRYSHQVEPGQTVADQTMVTNVGTEPLTVTMKAADAYNTATGEFALYESKVAADDAGSWIAFADGEPTQEVALEPGKSAVVDFTLTVPANATPGDHAAGVLATWVQGEGELQVERRIATRLYARVAGDLQPVLTASSFSGTYHSQLNPFDGSVTVSTTVTNNGNVALGGTLDVEVGTWFGATVGAPELVTLDEILPGNTRTVEVIVDGVPAAVYVTPKLTLRSSIEGDALDPGTLPVIQREAFAWAVPWAVLGALALVAVGILVWRWRRRVHARRAAEWIAFTEAEAQRKAAESSAPELVAADGGR